MNASNDESQNPNENRPSENEQQRKKGKGRQKITMAKIENETNLQVTFSKRRAGVFKKASELSTLCGAESAVVVFSPGNKPHSFGHPDVDTVASRLLHPAAGGAPARANYTEQIIMSHSGNFTQLRNEELSNVEADLERAKARKKELDSFINGGHLTAPPQLEGLSYEQLEKLKKSVLKFKSEFEAKVESSGVANPSRRYNGGGGGGAAAASAAAGGSVAAAVDPSYGYIPSYGGGDINGDGGSYNIPAPSYALPEDVNYGGYMVQYPGMSLGGYNNYGDPAAVVPYYAGTGSSDAGADGGREAAARADERSCRYLGFGNNYRSHQF